MPPALLAASLSCMCTGLFAKRSCQSKTFGCHSIAEAALAIAAFVSPTISSMLRLVISPCCACSTPASAQQEHHRSNAWLMQAAADIGAARAAHQSSRGAVQYGPGRPGKAPEQGHAGECWAAVANCIQAWEQHKAASSIQPLNLGPGWVWHT